MRLPIYCALVVAFASLVTVRASSGDDSGLAAILDHLDDLYTDKASHATMTMSIVTEHAARTVSMETWSKGADKLLVRIDAPEKEQGTATLKLGTNVWNYLPRINLVTKISASLLSAPWMGSHVTNNDIVKHSRMTEVYGYTTTFEGDRGGEAVMDITLDPKPNAAVVWGRVVVTVRLRDKNPIQTKYFDESKALAQTWTYSDVRRLGGRDVPGTIKIVPANKPTESTEIRYSSIEYNPPLSDDIFSLRNLQR
jgi:outer membrane lipoprotein-sorting protein